MNKSFKELTSVGSLKSPAVSKLEKNVLSVEKPITYSIISVTGESHKPKFTCKAECDNVIAYGIGSKKKDAMKCAGLNLFKLIDQNRNSWTPSALLELISNNQFTQNMLNPISQLQELCTKLYCEPPKYIFHVNLLDCTKPTHEVTCMLKSYAFKADGNTKRIAKKRAAQLVYIKLCIESIISPLDN